MINKLIASNIHLEEKLTEVNDLLEEVLPLLKFYSQNLVAPKSVEDEVDKVIRKIEQK